MDWLFKGESITDEMIPKGAIGFIYLITHTTSGRKYIGRKLLTKAHRRQQNKKIIRSRVESDWRSYWSSSPELLKLIEQEGTDNFVREVLLFAENKSALMYLEEKFQYGLGVLENDGWFNTNIRSKLFYRVVNKIDTVEMNTVLESVKQR